MEAYSNRKCTREIWKMPTCEREREKKTIEMQTNKLQRVKRKINRYRNVHEYITKSELFKVQKAHLVRLFKVEPIRIMFTCSNQ